MVGIPRGAWALPITVVARSSPQEGLRIRTRCRILKQSSQLGYSERAWGVPRTIAEVE